MSLSWCGWRGIDVLGWLYENNYMPDFLNRASRAFPKVKQREKPRNLAAIAFCCVCLSGTRVGVPRSPNSAWKPLSLSRSSFTITANTSRLRPLCTLVSVVSALTATFSPASSLSQASCLVHNSLCSQSNHWWRSFPYPTALLHPVPLSS